MQSNSADRKRPTKVLFIGKRFYTNLDTLEDAFGRIYQLPFHWASSGINIELWLIDYHSREKIIRATDSLTAVSTPIFTIGTFLRTAKLLIFGHTYSHIVSTGDCYIGLLGLLIAKRSKSTFIFDVYDKYDEFSGYLRIPGLNLFQFLMQKADHLLFASRLLSKQYFRQEKLDLVVRNGIDTAKFLPLEMNRCRTELDLPREKVFVGYFGGMEPGRGVQDLIAALQQLRQEGLKVELLIGGCLTPNIELDTPGVRYVGVVPFDNMPKMLGACNLLAVPYRRSAIMDSGSSNKIGEYLACSRPLVATRTPNLVENFPETALQLGDRLAAPENPTDLARVIRAQLTDPILCPLPKGWDWPGIAMMVATQLSLLPILGDDDRSG